jgi:hypothetical protein
VAGFAGADPVVFVGLVGDAGDGGVGALLAAHFVQGKKGEASGAVGLVDGGGFVADEDGAVAVELAAGLEILRNRRLEPGVVPDGRRGPSSIA